MQRSAQKNMTLITALCWGACQLSPEINSSHRESAPGISALPAPRNLSNFPYWNDTNLHRQQSQHQSTPVSDHQLTSANVCDTDPLLPLPEASPDSRQHPNRASLLLNRLPSGSITHRPIWTETFRVCFTVPRCHRKCSRYWSSTQMLAEASGCHGWRVNLTNDSNFTGSLCPWWAQLVLVLRRADW